MRVLRMHFILSMIVAATISTFAREINKDIHKTYDYREGIKLFLDHGDGDVNISAWDRKEVDVSVRYHMEYESVGVGAKTDFDVDFRQKNDVIYVTGREASFSGVGYFSTRHYEYVYTIRAPKTLQIELHGDDGDVQVSSWEGVIQCELNDGDIHLHDIKSKSVDLTVEDGDVELEDIRADLKVIAEDGDIILRHCVFTDGRFISEDGDISMFDVSGNLDARLEDGDMVVKNAALKQCTIHCVDGDVFVGLSNERAPDIDIQTEDGDITVQLEKKMSASIDLKTLDGRISVSLTGVTKVRKVESRWSGELNDGLGNIRVRSDGGDIRLQGR